MLTVSEFRDEFVRACLGRGLHHAFSRPLVGWALDKSVVIGWGQKVGGYRVGGHKV